MLINRYVYRWGKIYFEPFDEIGRIIFFFFNNDNLMYLLSFELD